MQEGTFRENHEELSGTVISHLSSTNELAVLGQKYSSLGSGPRGPHWRQKLMRPTEGRIKDGSRDPRRTWEQRFSIYFTSIERVLEPSSHIWQVDTNLLLESLRLRAGSSENLPITPCSSMWALSGVNLGLRTVIQRQISPSVHCANPQAPH